MILGCYFAATKNLILRRSAEQPNNAIILGHRIKFRKILQQRSSQAPAKGELCGMMQGSEVTHTLSPIVAPYRAPCPTQTRVDFPSPTGISHVEFRNFYAATIAVDAYCEHTQAHSPHPLPPPPQFDFQRVLSER